MCKRLWSRTVKRSKYSLLFYTTFCAELFHAFSLDCFHGTFNVFPVKQDSPMPLSQAKCHPLFCPVSFLLLVFRRLCCTVSSVHLVEHLHLLLIASQFFWIKAELLLFETWVCHGSRGNRDCMSVLVGVDVALGYSHTTQSLCLFNGSIAFY